MSREIVVWCRGAQPRRVVCYDTGTPGLVVHHDIGGDGWNVTHERSGRRVGGLTWDSRLNAFGFAVRLRGLADWTLTSKDLRALAIGPAVRGAAEGAAP